MSLSSQLHEASDDRVLWQQFIAGDVEAFDKLMSSHFRSLFHYGSKFSKDKEFVTLQKSNHVIGLDYEKEIVFEDIEKFLAKNSTPITQ